jgi:phage terminase large subunit-like protein
MDSKNISYIDEILDNKRLRVGLARESHQYFFNLYFPHYIKCKSANFHKRFFEISEDLKQRIEILISFRGSAKSAIMSMSYPLWSIVGRPQKKFIVLLGKTQNQARAMVENIKRELESNKVLIADLGPFQESSNDVSNYSLYFPWYDAKIVGVSMEQSIRGLRYKENRPDLIIADDIEHLASVATQEGRDKLYNWVNGEILTLGQENTKYIFIGNLLHEDSLLMRLKSDYKKGNLDARCIEIPLVNDKGSITWSGLYPGKEAIEAKKKTVPDLITWNREFMLKITSPDTQIVDPKLIQYYDGRIEDIKNLFRYQSTVVSVDPAISKKGNAAKTAILISHVYRKNKDLMIVIDKRIVNDRLDFNEITNKLIYIDESLRKENKFPKIIIENAGYQQSLIDYLKPRLHTKVEGLTVRGAKDERLQAVAHLIESGNVLLPKTTSSVLTNQICYFHTEKYHDLSDALSMGLNYIIKNQPKGFLGVDLLRTSTDSNKPVTPFSHEYNERKKNEYERLEKMNDDGYFRY